MTPLHETMPEPTIESAAPPVDRRRAPRPTSRRRRQLSRVSLFAPALLIVTVISIIPVGYAAADPVRRSRRALDELIVDWQ